MSCFCQKSSGVVVDIPQLVHEKLISIAAVYPTAKYVCVLSNSGDLVSSLLSDPSPPPDLLALIATLRRSAIQFAMTLNQLDCPVIHLSGETHLFSCYEVGDYMLAYYTEIDNRHYIMVDIEHNQRILEIVDELRLILQNSLIMNEGRNVI